MKTNIQQHPAVRLARGVLGQVGRGFAAVVGGLFAAFVAVLRAGVSDDDASQQDNNGENCPGSYRWPHDTPHDVHDYNS
ncbi:MAG: hypothetical protein WD005_02445 [Haliea sp.]